MATIPANKRLLEWLDRWGQTQVAFAADLNISQPHMSGLLSGRRTPSLELAALIEARTGIPAVSWVIEKDGVSA